MQEEVDYTEIFFEREVTVMSIANTSNIIFHIITFKDYNSLSFRYQVLPNFVFHLNTANKIGNYES